MVPERVMRRVDKTDGCWNWTGAKTDRGYGTVAAWDGRKTAYIHRAFYEEFVGPIPDGLVVDHLCDNRICCNPAHLAVTTARANIERSPRFAGNWTHCSNGHEWTAENTYIRPDTGHRQCRACGRERDRRRGRSRSHRG